MHSRRIASRTHLELIFLPASQALQRKQKSKAMLTPSNQPLQLMILQFRQLKSWRAMVRLQPARRCSRSKRHSQKTLP